MRFEWLAQQGKHVLKLLRVKKKRGRERERERNLKHEIRGLRSSPEKLRTHGWKDLEAWGESARLPLYRWSTSRSLIMQTVARVPRNSTEQISFRGNGTQPRVFRSPAGSLKVRESDEGGENRVPAVKSRRGVASTCTHRVPSLGFRSAFHTPSARWEQFSIRHFRHRVDLFGSTVFK